MRISLQAFTLERNLRRANTCESQGDVDPMPYRLEYRYIELTYRLLTWTLDNPRTTHEDESRGRTLGDPYV